MKLSSLALAGIAAAGLFATAASSQAQVVYSSGHGDIGIEYNDHHDTSFNVHWHLSSGEYAPEDVVALFSTISSSTAGNILAALGGPSGNVYRGGSHSYNPNLGFGGHLHFHDGFVDDIITVSLVGFSGAGNFALGHDGDVFFSSFDSGLTLDNNRIDFLLSPSGGDADIHAHFDWFFSEVGRYDITLLWSGELVGGGTVTGQGTFTMYAGEAIPEPGTWALLLTSAAGLLAFRHRRFRSVIKA